MQKKCGARGRRGVDIRKPKFCAACSIRVPIAGQRPICIRRTLLSEGAVSSSVLPLIFVGRSRWGMMPAEHFSLHSGTDIQPLRKDKAALTVDVSKLARLVKRTKAENRTGNRCTRNSFENRDCENAHFGRRLLPRNFFHVSSNFRLALHESC